MSASEVLCELLDERGMEHQDYEFSPGVKTTSWDIDTSDPRYEVCAAFEEFDGGTTFLRFWNPTPKQAVEATLGPLVTGDTSDGYHTFNELYHHRAVLFSVIVRDHHEVAWKSKEHHDGTMYDGMFIVGIETPEGQATYHYDIDSYWEMFDCKELERAPEWDGHTPDEAIERIATLGRGTCGEWRNECTYYDPTGVDAELWCEHCDKQLEVDWGFCPHCGRMVEVSA